MQQECKCNFILIMEENKLQCLTLMLLVINWANTKWCKKSLKDTKTLAHGYSSESAQWDLSNEYQHERVSMAFKDLRVLALLMKVASALEGLTLQMLRLLSSKAQGRRDLWKLSKPCRVGIHLKALAEYSQISTHMPGFWVVFSFFASFCFD